MAATKKVKAVGPGKLKRAKKVVPTNVDLKQYRLRYGTPNEMCEPIKIATEAKVRGDIVKHLRTEIEPWCKRFNAAGLATIEQLIIDLEASMIRVGTLDVDQRKYVGSHFNTGTRISGCYDDRYGLVIVYEFWKEFA